MMTEIKKSVLAGIAISIGGCVYMASVSAGIPWLGSILFAGGLYAVCVYGFNLYTGKVGYIGYHFRDTAYIAFVLRVCFFNILTTFLLGIAVGRYFPAIRDAALASYAKKLASPLMKDFISSLFCGMLMFLAVDTWKQGHKAGLFIYVPLFITAGFDHSIANSFYNGAALSESTWTLQNLWFVLIVIAGNAAGGMIIPLLTREEVSEV